MVEDSSVQFLPHSTRPLEGGENYSCQPGGGREGRGGEGRGGEGVKVFIYTVNTLNCVNTYTLFNVNTDHV